MSITSSGLQLKTSHRALRSTIELLSSMRFAVSLLVLLAIASIIGTVLKQEDPYPNYVNQFGPFWADIFRALGLYFVYSSWWFILILVFLVVSVSLCVLRNGPKIIGDLRRWQDRVREDSLRAFPHQAEYHAPITRAEAVARLAALIGERGYRYVTRETGNATLIAGKRGAFNKLGYLFTHLAIVVICAGGLLDSNLAIRAQLKLFDKSPVHANTMIGALSATHRLSPSNPTFRGYAWVPEGQQVSTAILNQADGVLIQDLPFTIQLNKFIIDYYSTGMPKRFASEIVVTDPATGQALPARVEVNQPFTYKGISIYQSSFDDGGSTLRITAYPMQGTNASPFMLTGKVGGTAMLAGRHNGDDADMTVEFTGFRPINVEHLTNGDSQPDARGIAHRTLLERFDERLGSAVKISAPRDLHNVGPSIQYKLRDCNGQAREFNHYMLPVELDGERVFLAGVRSRSDEPFRYLRIPADSQGTVKEWMLLRAALNDRQLREQAAKDFARRAVARQKPDSLPGQERQSLEESVLRVLNLFSGAAGNISANPSSAADDVPAGGFAAVAAFIDQSVPKADQQKAAGLLLRILEGSIWELWQQARRQAGEAPLAEGPANSRFIGSAINALSDSFFYHAPVFLQLDSFNEVKASVFQLTRAPGKKIVYLGTLLLVLGVFAMFFVRERRVWCWIKAGGDSSSGCHARLAMSAARITLDFEREFTALSDAVSIALDQRATAYPNSPPSVN